MEAFYASETVKKVQIFLTVSKNAITFAPHSGTKVLASLAASLAVQGIAGHLIPFEAGFAPRAPHLSAAFSFCNEGFFDKLGGVLRLFLTLAGGSKYLFSPVQNPRAFESINPKKL